MIAARRIRPGLFLRTALVAVALALAAGPACAAEGDEGTLAGDGAVRMTPQEAIRALAEPAPQGLPPGEEMAYWVRRQQAAFTVGDSRLRIEALRRLVVLTTREDGNSPYDGYLWRELQRYGNQTEALALGERLVAQKSILPTGHILYLLFLGQDYSQIGNRARARELLVQAETETRRESAAVVGTEGTFIAVETERLRSIIAQYDADWVSAESSAQKSLALANDLVATLRANPAGDPMQYDRAIRTRNPCMTRLVAVYSAEGKSAEAELIARLGIRNAQEEKTGGTTVGYWYGRIAQAKLAQRRYQEAFDAATKSVEVLTASGALASSDYMITSDIYLMQALFGLEGWEKADRLAASMREATAADAVARARFDSPVLQAFLHLVNERTAAALQRIDPATRYRARNYGETHPLTIEAKSVRAMIYQAQGQTRNALSDYGAVFDSIFATDTSFADAEPAGLRGFYTPLALRSYLRLVEAMYRENGNRGVSDAVASDAFRVADRLRASAVQQALIDGSARVAATNPAIADLSRREQDERRKSRELITRLNAQLEEDQKLTREAEERQKARPDLAEAGRDNERAQQRRTEISHSRDGVAVADKARGEILRELAKRFPEYQALVNPKPPTLDQTAELLDRNEALVSIFPTSFGTFVWATGGSRGPMFHVSPLKQADVKALVARLRATLDVGDRPSPGAVAFDAAASYRLYAELLAPLAQRLAGADSLIFVVNGDLAQVPLGVLVTDAPAPTGAGAPAPAWLVRKAAVTQVSTVAAFSAVRRARRGTAPAVAFAGFGDPAFRRTAPPATPGAVRAILKAPIGATREATFSAADYAELPSLPETRDEVLAIARVLGADPQHDIFLGAQASRKTVLATDLSARRVLEFATHGLKPGDLPGLSRPALAMAATDDLDESPLLVLDDVMTLKLNADWVVLSACNTASADGRAEEALSGLARGFFFAGARSVLVTHWAVESRSAQQLVTRTFEAIARDPSRGRAEALRQAQLELIDGKAGDAYRQPFFWAPYALAGDPSH
jgi:CHAT domain-containing protein